MKDKVREKASSTVDAELLSQLVLNFRAGCVKEHIINWKAITTDPVILDAIQHHNIEFEGFCRPVQTTQPRQIIFSSADKDIINLEIAKLLNKGVIEPSKPSDGDFISTIFVRPKKDGSHRLILNLKPLNEFVAYYHFKMDTIHAALKLMRPGCFMASVDLKDAYYSIPISVEDRNFLKFEWQGNYFRFTCLPNGLASAPRLFTKVLKPIYAHLRSLGHFCMGHIDDSFLMGHTYTSCEENIWETTNMFLKLGFVIHPTKSVLIPTQELEFLGFLLNSNSMTIRLPPRKAITVEQACENLLNQSNPTIREVARVIGLLVSSLPGVQFGELHYRHLERNKISALKINKGDYDALMSLSAKARSELHWWVINVNTAFKNIMQTNPDLTLTTDASNTGWGATCKEQQTGGLWSTKEHCFHINYLEMKAVLFGLQSLCSDLTDKHIRIQSDNTTTVSYINAMGGMKSNDCNVMALQIWQWANSRNIWLSSCHLPGVDNVVADHESRNFDGSTEWSLNTKVFEDISNKWGPFQIDLFASRLNYKVQDYVSWKPDPGAKFVNAFHMNWANSYFYCFPPFSVIASCLQKIEFHEATGVILIPLWQTQPWFTTLLHLLIDRPLLLPQSNNLLTQPHSGALHPLRKRLRLLACRVSGKASSRATFQGKLQKLSCNPGPLEHKSNTNRTSGDGFSFVVNNKFLPIAHL